MILQGDALIKLKELPEKSVNMCMTSPPHWALEIFINQYGYIILMRSKKTGRFEKGYTWRKTKPYWDRGWLYVEYIVKGKSAKEIADEQGCHSNNIYFWLLKHNIKTRNVSQARKLKYWGLQGEDNPMWNKRGELNPNWKGGITPERQEFYQSRKWKEVCSLVWKRDKATCRRCFIKSNEGIPFHIHHKSSFSNRELRADKNNLVLLCKVCHNFIHSKLNENREFLVGGVK